MHTYPPHMCMFFPSAGQLQAKLNRNWSSRVVPMKVCPKLWAFWAFWAFTKFTKFTSAWEVQKSVKQRCFPTDKQLGQLGQTSICNLYNLYNSCENCFLLLNVSKRKIRDWKTCFYLRLFAQSLSLQIWSVEYDEYPFAVLENIIDTYRYTISYNFIQLLRPFFPRFCGTRLETGSVLRPVRPIFVPFPFIPSAHERHGHGPCPSACPCPGHDMVTMWPLMWHWYLMMFDDVWWPKWFQNSQHDINRPWGYTNGWAICTVRPTAKFHEVSLALPCPVVPCLPFALPFWSPLRFLALPWWRSKWDLKVYADFPSWWLVSLARRLETEWWLQRADIRHLKDSQLTRCFEVRHHCAVLCWSKEREWRPLSQITST